MSKRHRRGSILLPNTGGLNFGIWLDGDKVTKARPRVISFRHEKEEVFTSLTQQMEDQREDWELTGRT
ncbi:MAG: hypothetical protein ACLFV7_10265 [Phycisphaerae bacterium]